VILINIYITSFYSTIYNQNIEISNEKNINDIIKIQGDTVAKMYEFKNGMQRNESIKPEEEFMVRSNSAAQADIKYNAVTDEQIEKLVNMFYASSNVTKVYNTLSNAV